MEHLRSFQSLSLSECLFLAIYFIMPSFGLLFGTSVLIAILSITVPAALFPLLGDLKYSKGLLANQFEAIVESITSSIDQELDSLSLLVGELSKLDWHGNIGEGSNSFARVLPFCRMHKAAEMVCLCKEDHNDKRVTSIVFDCNAQSYWVSANNSGAQVCDNNTFSSPTIPGSQLDGAFESSMYPLVMKASLKSDDSIHGVVVAAGSWKWIDGYINLLRTTSSNAFHLSILDGDLRTLATTLRGNGDTLCNLSSISGAIGLWSNDPARVNESDIRSFDCDGEDVYVRKQAVGYVVLLAPSQSYDWHGAMVSILAVAYAILVASAVLQLVLTWVLSLDLQSTFRLGVTLLPNIEGQGPPACAVRQIRFKEAIAISELWDRCMEVVRAEKAEKQREIAVARRKAEEVQGLCTHLLSNEMEHLLQGILGVVELLLESPLSADQVEMVNLVDISSRFLFLLLHNTLDYMQMQSGALTIHPDETYLEDEILLAVKIISTAAVKKNLDFCVYFAPMVPDVVIADKHRMKQILISLLSNSVKYTNEGYVSLLVTVTESKEEENIVKVGFVIKDTGTGMTGEAIMQHFERQEHLRTGDWSVTSRPEVGLSLTVHLVKMMHGTINCKSVTEGFGRGTTVSVAIPFQVVEPCRYTSVFSQVSVSRVAIIVMTHPNIVYDKEPGEGELSCQHYLDLLSSLSPADIRDSTTAMLLTLITWGVCLKLTCTLEGAAEIICNDGDKEDKEYTVFYDLSSNFGMSKSSQSQGSGAEIASTENNPMIYEDWRPLCDELRDLACQSTVAVLLDHPLCHALGENHSAAVQQLAAENEGIHLLTKPVKRPELFSILVGDEDDEPQTEISGLGAQNS